MKVIKINKAGYIYIFITIFLGFASINTGNNLLYIITLFLLAIMGVSGFLGKINISNFDVKVEFPDEIFANKPFNLRIEVTNKKRNFPSFMVYLKFSDKIIFIPYIRGKSKIVKIVDMTISKRGYYNLKSFTICSQFPFGFFKRFTYIKKDFSTIIFPEPIFYPLKYFSNNYSLNLDMENEFSLMPNREELISIRNYNSRDNLKDIHWKITAKTNEIKVKKFSSFEEYIIIDFEKIKINDLEKKFQQ